MKKSRNLQPVVAKKSKALKQWKRIFLLSLLCTIVFGTLMAVTASAASVDINVQAGDEAGNIGALEVIFIFAFFSLLPSIVLMMTSFTRIIIVLSFLRNALGTNQSPPNMVLTGLAIFLTLFIMRPTLQAMYTEAYQPYTEKQITSTEALQRASGPIKQFMLGETSIESLEMFLNISGEELPVIADANNPVELKELPLTVITPAFITSELSRAFLMGFLIFLPFLVIDMVVSSILMSMGMVMLPPAMISLPFKILLFVLVDGWNLMMGTLINSFH